MTLVDDRSKPGLGLDVDFDDSVSAIIIGDLTGKISAWNSHTQKLLGWSRDEVIGRSFAGFLVQPEHRGTLLEGIQACISANTQSAAGLCVRIPILHKENGTINTELTILPLRRAGKRCFFSVLKPLPDHDNVGPSSQPETSILQLSRDAILLMDTNGTIEYWNRGAERLFGFSAGEAVGRTGSELVALPSAPDLAASSHPLIQDGHWDAEIVVRRRDGVALTIMSRWEVERDDSGYPRRLLMSGTSGAQWQRVAKPAAQVAADNFHSLFGQHPDGVFVFNPNRRLIFANSALSRITGYSFDELLAMPIGKLFAQEEIHPLQRLFRNALKGRPQASENICLSKDGRPLDVSITLLPNIVDGRVVGVHGILKDIGQRKRDERRIVYLATHDGLTGLPNRNLLHDRMQHAIELARRSQCKVGVLFMDLNRFKIINDSLGHDKGDMLLCAIAERLKESVRDIDTVARLGGDEFVVILESIGEMEHVFRVAKNLLELVSQPVELEGNAVSVSTSIGASIFPDDGTDPATLLKNADLAMYEAKEYGTGQFLLYRPEMNAKAVARLLKETSLRYAIEHGQLTIHYQPRVDLNLNEIVGIEALVRWDHPEKGLIFPNNFIELAEETGMIEALGEWVLLSACLQLRKWRNLGLPPIKLSVNVSAVQLRSDRICDTVSIALEAADLDPSYLELEITESSLMQNLEESYATLERFQAMGVSLSIDDFGTGYSSLNYLKRLPINTLKIDKSFVRDVAHDPDDAAIVTATIAMAHNMQLRVVAEGVTSFDQMRFLESCNCDEIQGYLFCQPLPAPEIESFFRTCQLRGVLYSWNN